MSHTKGPWIRRAGIWSNQLENEAGEIVAEVSNLYKSSGETDANVRLIGAAPDMVEALTAMVQWFEKNSERFDYNKVEDHKTFDLIVFALLKAKGGAK